MYIWMEFYSIKKILLNFSILIVMSVITVCFKQDMVQCVIYIWQVTFKKSQNHTFIYICMI